jgi:hypothetical protein
LSEGATFCRDPASRFVYVGEQGQAQTLYINGDEIDLPSEVDGQFVALLADNCQLTAEQLATYLNQPTNSEWLCEQLASGYFLLLSDE